MIIDSKVIMHPPPPYASSSTGLPPFPGTSRPRLTLTSLPPHILLQIVYATFPQTPLPDQAKIERQRKTLYWLSVSLRLVDRTLYVACMHVLRSTHIPAYDALIRPPYTSDPFPLLAPPSSDTAPPPPSPYASQAPSAPEQKTSSPLNTLQRETATLDRFIALKVREDVWADESELHLEREEAYKDLFDLVQPRSRLEDLVRIYGVRDGVVCVGSPPASSFSSSAAAYAASASSSSKKSPPPPNTTKPRLHTSASASPLTTPTPAPALRTSPNSSSASLHRIPTTFTTKSTSASSFLSSLFSSRKRSPPTQNTVSPFPQANPKREITPIPFHLLSVSFSPRQVGLILHPAKRTIVSTPRTREERLEAAARRLVRELRAWLEEGG
ncbi:hypothetical protein LshimejAT787_1601910 [Lyophyllum shimeji]|uniref:Uncharacterized protein n=1 Tax=Lyophyllum shimeji TaxID=47721 RepID=A0A9P3UVL1_LYOSH|nr:hypothetical protein LshimejAT787_1601910 [Lyophyllum shimeji]